MTRLFFINRLQKKMGFKRCWDSSCPRVWSQWEENGSQWIVQDIPPEDDELALRLLLDHLCPDEPLCSHSNVIEDAESMKHAEEFWRECLLLRTSLGCYTNVDGKKTLVALNVCVVDTVEQRQPEVEIQGETWKNVIGALEFMEHKCDAFKYLEVDTLLHGLGLVVSKEYRGFGLGSKILSAREPMCKFLGVTATSTVFTGPASQRSAAKVDFTTIAIGSLKEIAESGLKYPQDENHVLKLMVKKYT